MHTRRVSAWIPIRTTVLDADDDGELTDQKISTFLTDLPAALSKLTPEVQKVTVIVATPPAELLSHLSRNSSLISSRLFQAVQIAAEVSFQETRHEVAVDLKDDESFILAIAGYYLTKGIELALHLSELAYPGAISTSEGVAVFENQLLGPIEAKRFLSAFRPPEFQETGWPRVQYLTLPRTVDWAIEIGMLSSSLATSRVQRALAAFTHIVGLGGQREGEILFRAMQGLEAFYCDGVGDLRRQLSEKSRLWLGNTADKRNIVGQLYDLRSQFIHGSAKMTYWQDVRDPHDEDPKTMNRFSGGATFAVQMLTATLQRCIEEAVNNITWSFSHSVESSSEKDS